MAAFTPSRAYHPRAHARGKPAAVGRRSASAIGASALETLAGLTTISIDSGDLDVVASFAATGLVTDATTNPLFVSQAGSKGDARYEGMVDDAVAFAQTRARASGLDAAARVDLAVDRLAVNLGAQLAGLVPGRVSTEVDVSLSYDITGSVERARRIIELYDDINVGRDRILIKLAGTWEGIQAAGILEKEGIQCNITLVFGFLQAVAAAQAGVHLISPFPGRVLEWHKANSGQEAYEPAADPGVVGVKRMYSFFRRYGYDTICMPASWRPSRGKGVEGSELDQILALAGVDEMTIPAPLLESLQLADGGVITQQCEPVNAAAACSDPDEKLDKASWDLNWGKDHCGQAKLNEGIAAFMSETDKLKGILSSKFA